MNKKISQEYAEESAFTLIEVTVVCAVVAVLMGLLFPVLRMMQQRAWDHADRNLCLQVANAWNQLYVDNRRFPSDALLTIETGKTISYQADAAFTMNRGVSSLLNWWKVRDPRPWNDADLYLLSYSEYDDTTSLEKWPRDIYFTRDDYQKKWGIMGSWLSRQLNASRDQQTFMDELNFEQLDAGLVHVALDTNDDGYVTVPGPSGDIELNRRFAAWVYSDENKTRMLTSW